MCQTMAPAASELKYRSISFTNPLTPALRMPPKKTSSSISTAPAMDAHSMGMLKKLLIMAPDESTCETMLMKMPTMQSTDPMVSARRPYSLRTISSSVVHPLRRSGPA